MSLGRNDLCPCGSGTKYKKCCGKLGPNRLALPAQQNTPAKAASTMQNEFRQLIELYNAGRYVELEDRARSLVDRYPDYGLGWKLLSATLLMQGKEALLALQNATKLLPGEAELHNNLGHILNKRGQLAEAEACFRLALQIKPDYADAHYNLGVLQGRQNKLDEAVVSYRQAALLNPNHADAHYNLGVLQGRQNRLDEAAVSYRQAVLLNPNHADAHGNLGITHMAQGRLDEALACFQQQIRITPENDTAQHLIASLTGNNTKHAPIRYVESVFDDYADKFDTHLQQILEYEVPKKLVALIMQHSTPPVEKWDILDIGCGTGLVGSAIAPFTRQLVGVDLSAGMLEKAHARNLYQRLERLDLLTMMRGEKASSYDVIIAADVFVYLGKLDEIIGEIKRLLRSGGIFAFSVEDLVALRNGEAGQGVQREYQLENTGRYTHSVGYITRLASANGFLTHEMAATQIRMELGKSVNGYLVLWKS